MWGNNLPEDLPNNHQKYIWCLNCSLNENEKYHLPYSKKLTRNDFKAKVTNAEEINAVEELLLYSFNEINTVFTSGFQVYEINANPRQVCRFSKGKNTRILVYNVTIAFFLTQQYFFFLNTTKSSQ